MNRARAEAFSLLSSEAVRMRAHALLALGLKDELPHFRVDLDRLERAADLVADTTRAAYPTLDVPVHSRWRHFVFQGVDRWAALKGTRSWMADELARGAFDLAIVSVLLDAGAGTRWTYRDHRSGAMIGRSEGLALATLAMFEAGAFSADRADPLRVDAQVLRHYPAEALCCGLQVSDANPLIGIKGRLRLLRRLGQLVTEQPQIFGRHDAPRPGGLYDVFAAAAQKNHAIRAPEILSGLLRHLLPIWPTRQVLSGIALGDCWPHPLMRTHDTTDRLVPLHKLSQWLAYSLIEPLQWAGHAVTEIDGLTGLAEYRNGGLFVDTGVLQLRDGAQAARDHDVGSPLVVEWRALTVALLDELAVKVRGRLSLDAASFPLARVLQGGTWAAGRALAGKLRADGSPPIRVNSDGSVF